MVGVGGSGKQSLARLSGFICGYATYTIVISGNYNMNNFREDLQKMYKRAGVKVRPSSSKSCDISTVASASSNMIQVADNLLNNGLAVPLSVRHVEHVHNTGWCTIALMLYLTWPV